MRLDFSRRFSQRAGYYSKYRPAYPNAILHILRREIGFSSKSIVADIGSGTGILTKVFLENGNRVFGVEPADQMRFHAERDLAKFRSFVSVKGTAERTTLKPKSVDLIAVGQALHWFDPPRTIKEFSRISRLGGSLCVVYNNRKNDRFGRAYNEVIGRHHRDNAQVPSPDGKYISGFFEGGRCSTSEVPNEQSLDFRGLLGRLLSASYMPTQNEGGRYLDLRRDVRDLFERFNSGGRVRLRYRTKVYVGRAG